MGMREHCEVLAEILAEVLVGMLFTCNMATGLYLSHNTVVTLYSKQKHLDTTI